MQQKETPRALGCANSLPLRLKRHESAGAAVAFFDCGGIEIGIADSERSERPEIAGERGADGGIGRTAGPRCEAAAGRATPGNVMDDDLTVSRRRAWRCLVYRQCGGGWRAGSTHQSQDGENKSQATHDNLLVSCVSLLNFSSIETQPDLPKPLAGRADPPIFNA
jgi:hypothetical protein